MLLSKTQLLDWRQCPRKLWLGVHQPALAADKDSALQRRSVDGRLVEERARACIPAAFRWLPASDDKPADALAAQSAMAKHPGTAFVEVAMHAQGLYARADALCPHPEGGYALLETKASTFPFKRDKVTPDKPEVHHVEDVAIQAWIAAESGIELKLAALNLLDNQWRYAGEGDYEGLFKRYPLNAHVKEVVNEVPIWLKLAQDVVAGPMPACQTGAHCNKPHPCPFHGHCKALEPAGEAHPIELLPDMAGKTLARKLKETQGYVSLLQPHPSELVGANAELFCRMQRAHATGVPILEQGAYEVLDSLPYPRYYFDFEGIDLPVPRWEGVRAYEQIPFQWSCHIETAPGVFEHHAFLDVTGNDPSLPCIQALQRVIALDDGPILVYYQTYEKGRFKELAERHPEHAELMKNFIERLVDLHPLVKQNYYHPKMKGSFSIKKVLPTVAPHLGYDNLEQVQDGTAAQLAYLHYCFSPDMSPAERENLRQDMLSYCEQDTWAMVEVAYFLQSLPSPVDLRPAPQAVAAPSLNMKHIAQGVGGSLPAPAALYAQATQEVFDDIPL